MRHRLQQKVFAGRENRSSSPQKSRTPSTFTTSYNSKNPHLTKKNKLHSKSTYFYRWGSSSKLSSSLSYVVPSVCTLALLVGGIIAINPILDNVEKVNAESDENISLQTNGTLSLDLADAASQQTSAEVGKVAYRNNVFTVSGSNIAHYTVSLNTANGETGELVGRDNPYITIGKVEAETMPADFEDNTWGYAITNNTNSSVGASLSYNPIPSGTENHNNSVVLARKYLTSTGSVSDRYNLFFAAKFGSNVPSDHYEAKIYLSVVANSESVSNIGFTGGGKTITTMQDMTSSICSGASSGRTGKLYDVRDNKTYWVAKLADDNCWMTQNLDFDIPKTLYSDTSNVSETTTSGAEKNTTTSLWPASNNTYQGYYDPGDYIYMGPSNGHGQDTTNACNDVESITNAKCTYYQPVTLSTAATDLHYHIGNYYSYPAATLDQIDSQTTGIASIDICPSGWQLPVFGDNTKSFSRLLSSYGISGSTNISKIYASPLYFVYNGYINSGRLSEAGYKGNYRTSAATNSSYIGAHYMYFTNQANTNGHWYRSIGMPIRCVAK